MRIQIVSDLHLEFPANRKWLEENPLVPIGDILLIAGDSYCLCNPEDGEAFMERISKDFPLVISTLGNHEFYGSALALAYPDYERTISANHRCLNNRVYIHEGLRIICTVLWSKVPANSANEVGSRLNDYRHILKFMEDGSISPITVADSNACHRLSREFLARELAKPFEGKTIVLSHHLPSYQCVPAQFRASKLVSGFATALDELIISNPQVSHWIYGHAHDFHQISVGKTMLTRNPLGYVEQGDHQDFRRDFCIEL